MGYKYDKEKKTWEVWYGCWTNRRTKFINSRRTNIRNEFAAKKVEKELVLLVQRKIDKTNLPDWPKLIEMYLKHCEKNGLAKKTIYNADKCLKAATLPLWENKLIDAITTEEIRDLILITFEDSSESYRKALLKFIRLAFEVAVESGLLQRNPAPQMKFKIGKKLKTVLTYEQTKKLLNKAKELDWEWYPHVTVALYTGMRSGEMYALTWEKVDFEVRQIRVDTSWNNKDGFKETKSGDDRIVDIASELLLFLKDLKLKTGKIGFVLPRVGRWDKGEQARELRMFLQAIGLPPIRFHDLRATWATMMLSRGVEPVKVMSMGGWRGMDTMMRYIREAGIDIKGIADVIKIHDPKEKCGVVKKMSEYL